MKNKTIILQNGRRIRKFDIKTKSIYGNKNQQPGTGFQLDYRLGCFFILKKQNKQVSV